MPPKTKAEQKAKQAKIEDRTFGLKNKNKSKKVQQFVKAVETSVKFAGISAQERRDAERAKAAREAQKHAKEAAEMEKAALFKSVVNKTVVPSGVDPKSVLCEFYKVGKCVRGNKCKYSHDMAVERKTAKIDVYTDPRSLDKMDNWDQSKLEEVVAKKAAKGKLPPTDIVCKYFLDAIENSVYGWFWECPSGVDCHYRHCLPPGFVLKTKADKLREKENPDNDEETLEEKIEKQRKALDLSKCTPMTLELFQKWKADKEARRIAEVETKRITAEKAAKGSGLGVMSGRDLFRYDPTLFADDDDAEAEYEIDEEYDPAQHEEEEGHYDSQAASEDENEERKSDDEQDDEAEEEKEGPSSAAASSSSVDAAAAAIDKSLYLDDEDVPDA